MRFVLMPPNSLEHRALVKIIVSLWNLKDVRVLIANLDFNLGSSTIDREWKRIEKRITEKAEQFSIPQLLKENLLGCIKPIGMQIFEWIEIHHTNFELFLDLPAEFCWTPQGTLDKKKTAEVLVKDQSLDLVTRYKLACIYCLEEGIIALWNTLSEDLKQSFVCGNSPTVAKWDHNWIILFWSQLMKRRGLGDAPTSYKDEFEESACLDNVVAVEYFLQKLTPEERKESLVEVVEDITYVDVLRLLLTEMDEGQQIKVFKDAPDSVLLCSLRWPWQSNFMEIANCMWDFISKEAYENTLTSIIHNVKSGYQDCDYLQLFKEFWQKSPDVLKSSVRNDFGKDCLLRSLFDIKDKRNMRLILKDATVAERDKLIYSATVNDFCQECIRDNEWDYLEFWIQECFSSKDLMLKFKEGFEKHKKQIIVEDILVKNKHKWNQIFCLSDDSIRKYNKRSADESESSSSKRFRSLQ